MDHPSVSVSSFMKPEARLNGLTRRHILLALRYSSGIDGSRPATCLSPSSVNRPGMRSGEQIASQLVCVYKTLSETGQVRLAARDWRQEPIVEFNLLSDRRDLERLMDGFRAARRHAFERGLEGGGNGPVPGRATATGCARLASSTTGTGD